jgi:single-strand DNA-binding protein
MNRVILCGRLTKDAEITYTQGNNMAVARLTLAVDRRFKQEGQPTADFIRCIAFGKTAEFFERFGHKGTKFLIEGRIQTGSYTNKDGQKVYTTDVVVENTEFCDSKNSSGSSAEPQPKPDDGFMNIPDGIGEELPFN